jgi:hypothetical protein
MGVRVVESLGHLLTLLRIDLGAGCGNVVATGAVSLLHQNSLRNYANSTVVRFRARDILSLTEVNINLDTLQHVHFFLLPLLL